MLEVYNLDAIFEMVDEYKNILGQKYCEIEISNPRYEYSIPYGTLEHYSASRADLFIGGVKRGRKSEKAEVIGNYVRYVFDKKMF